MMCLTRCMVVLCCGALARAGVHSDACSSDADGDKLFTTPFYFSYVKNETFQLTLILKNVPSTIDRATLSSQTGDLFTEQAVPLQQRACSSGPHWLVLARERTRLLLMLYARGVLRDVTVLAYGRDAATVTHRLADLKYRSNTHCSSFPHTACVVGVDLNNAYKDKRTSPRAPDAEQQSDRAERTDTDDTASADTASADTARVAQDTPPTPTHTDNGKEAASEKSQIIVISVCVAGAAGALLCVLALGVRVCRAQPAPQHEPAGPFYVNLLFREECAREIELIEQHQYEEIHPRRH